MRGIGRGSEQRQVRDAYGFALLMVLVSTLALVASGSPIISPLAAFAGFMQVGALVLTLRVSGVRHSWARLGTAIAIVLFIFAVAGLFLAEDMARTPGLVVWLLLTLTTIAAITRRLVTYREVTVQLLMGLLVIYLLIGTSFGLAYSVVNEFAPPALTNGAEGIASSIYFSFITLATVGYGDISPGTDVARALAIAEALIGQLYLVSVVSLAVSRLGTRRQSDTASAIEERVTAFAKGTEDGSAQD